MPAQEDRLTVDEGVDYLTTTTGVPLSPEVLVDICESGWDPCRLDREQGWTIAAGDISGEDTARQLMERIARLASEREDAAEAMVEPPAGAEGDEDI